MSAASKQSLRKSLRQRRKSFHDERAFAAHDLARIFQHASLPLPAVAAVYRAAGSEIDPEPLADWLAKQGVRIVLPVVVERDVTLVFREAVGGFDEVDALGLPVPPADAPMLRPDVIFVPLLGFDRTGARLGQGGGYYDRTLAALRAEAAPVLAFGLAYAGQEVDRIPTDEHDQRLDGVLTEKAYLPFP